MQSFGLYKILHQMLNIFLTISTSNLCSTRKNLKGTGHKIGRINEIFS